MDIEVFHPLGQGGVPCFDILLFVGKRCSKPLANFRNEVNGEFEFGVMINDRLLHHFGWKVRQVADPVLPTSTEKVPIALTAPIARFRIDQPRRALVSLTPVAEQGTFQVVR
ncbi:MAG TPA: hypothetical protein VJV41_00410 [Mycobacterium sp.]|nr:hypothetical protein [Mycobacterium sp.]HKP39457.1 hypothetical protein [Mycobacterium sp.]